MRCGLMKTNGLSAECTRQSCVYWSDPVGLPPKAASPCALDRFSLLGPRPDRLALWLLELKFKTESGVDGLRSA